MHNWVSIIAGGVKGWKLQEGWSREAVADVIVKVHYQMDWEKTTGLQFQMTGADEYQRMHVNANKLFRWLDELTKDNNLLPTNFIPSILAAMPENIRLETVNHLLARVGLSAQSIQTKANDAPLNMLRGIMSQTAVVNQSYLNLLDGVDPGEVQEALDATNEAIHQLNDAKMSLHSMLIKEEVVHGPRH